MTMSSERVAGTGASEMADAHALTATMTGAMEKAMASGTTLVDRYQAVNRELTAFWLERLACCGELFGQLAACRSAGRLLTVQEEYRQQQMRAYTALWPRLMATFADGEPPAADKPTVNRPASKLERAA